MCRPRTHITGWELADRESLELTWPNLQLHGATFKKKAPKAIKEIKDFATKAMVRRPAQRPGLVRRDQLARNLKRLRD